MTLPILEQPGAEPWYSHGLAFTCTQCGNCCTGGPGVVWISREEIRRLADHLKLTPPEVVDRYCRTIDGKFSLTENRNARGEYDCVFLHEAPGTPNADGVVQPRRTCTIYPVRPLQCRTWPFWSENLIKEEIWDRSSRRCPGMNYGKKWPVERIHQMRDATDWPPAPPSSD
ncbi:MAG: YkgJ family cysteine cluster protein [Phycisphaerae bacterium]|nr:YkgJ family cysteine cluster protein [Phycisphaerae bacterium]